ncbi:MAG: AI-2E family transporter [Bacteroidetes bacterium]|jgi:predicted PurR-regulated permease PerM|nr:AI-2E family transporter [Bacteroidota bacterium]
MTQPFLLRWLLGLASLVVITAGLKASASIMSIILLAFLLAFSIAPMLRWLLRRNIPSVIALTLTLILVFISGLAVVTLTAESIVLLVESLTTYEAELTSLKEALKATLTGIGIDPKVLTSDAVATPRETLKSLASLLDYTLDLLGDGILVALIMSFVLAELTVFYSEERTGKKFHSALYEQYHRISQDVVRYVSITGWNGFLNAIANLILLLALGVDYAVMWAFLSFLFNFIPNFGFVLALIPPALLGYLESGWWTALLVVLGYFILNFVAENIIKPRSMKDDLEISPLATVLSLIVWTYILGPVGAILAVPLTVTLQRILQEQTATPSEQSTEPLV